MDVILQEYEIICSAFTVGPSCCCTGYGKIDIVTAVAKRSAEYRLEGKEPEGHTGSRKLYTESQCGMKASACVRKTQMRVTRPRGDA